MPQANNKVDWCLKKAERELAEKGMHRGLVKVDEDIELAKKHLAKAEHNLVAAIYFDKGGFSDWSAPAFFYTIYHCFLAITRKFGYESRNQECTIALVEMLNEEGRIKLDKRFIDTLKITKLEDIHEDKVVSLRESFQYSVEIDFKEKDKFQALLNLCREAISQTKNIVLKE